MPKRRLPPRDFAWTSELAYVVGLLVTDGNLSKDGRHINMRSAEVPMLETFKACLDINSKIGASTKQNGSVTYSIQYSNVQFYDWLIKIGLSPAKSYTIGAIAVPDEFFRDYFRGCIDGDGNIRTYQDKYNFYRGRNYVTQRLFIRLVSASEKSIVWTQSKVEQLLKIKGAVIKNNPANESRVPIWELKFAKKESMRLIEWMYYSPNVPCLQRKRAVAEQALAIIARQKRLTYSMVQ